MMSLDADYLSNNRQNHLLNDPHPESRTIYKSAIIPYME